MKFDITRRMHVVDLQIENTTNPLHKAILENYRRHANLEVCGMWEEILKPDMTMPNAEYRIHIGTQLLSASGVEEISKIYLMMADSQSTVIYHTDEHIMVSDEGFMSQYMSHRFWPGQKLIDIAKIEVPDPKANYIMKQSLQTFFTYNADALLTGEHAYHGADMEITLCAPEDFISLAETKEKLLPLMKSAAGIKMR